MGSLRAFLRDKLGFLSSCAARYGDVVKLEIGMRTYLVSGPEDIRHVLVTNSDNYAKTPRVVGTRARRFFGDGVVTASGAQHLSARRMLQPLFHRRAVAQFTDEMVRATEEMLARWCHAVEVDVHAEMLALTQRIIARVLLGEESEDDLARFTRAVSVRRRYQEYLLGSVFPFPEYVPNALTRAYRRASRDIDAIIEAGVERRRRGDAEPGDLLSMLVHARFEDGSGMSGRLIRDEARTLAVGGYETLAEALTWAWYLLAQVPEADTRLAAEARAEASSGPLGAADVPRLAYARMVLAEAMRLYPPAWMFVRVAVHGDVLPSGVRVPARAKIYLSPWVTHRHPRYFPEPDRFDPERFTEKAIEGRPRWAYFPFGAGRRLCIGEDFAWMEGTLLLAHIAARFRLTLVPGQTIAPEPNVTLRPRNGIRMRPVLR